MDRAADSLDWPAELGERTHQDMRVSTTKFSVSPARAIDAIEAQLESMGADDWRISTGAPHRKSDGRPYANANPDEPGVVVRWFDDDDRFAVGCDYYDDWRDNIRAVGLYLEEKRKMVDRPIATVENEFAVAQLPAGDDDDGIGDVTLDRPAHEVIGVQPDAPQAVIDAAVQERKKDAHPDQGGSQRELKRVLQAEAELNGEHE